MDLLHDLIAWLIRYQLLVAGGFALVAFLGTRRYYQASLSAKLHDRLFELNKLTVEHADVAADFESMRMRQTPYFAYPASSGEAGKRYQQLRAYTYFRLNLYEEVFVATQGLFVRFSGRGDAWGKYLRDRMAHALVRELFEQDTQQFNARFVRFVRQSRAAPP